jgi:hypothetical protein
MGEPIKKEVEYLKEVDDVLDLVVKVIKVLKKKADYSELIGKLITAVNGAEKIPAEVKHTKALINTVFFRVGDIVEAFKDDEEKKE